MELDPLRFRGNLYLDGLPAWREFAWVGRRVRIGAEVELEILRPIERCKATSIDPATARADLNLPALLAGGEGHIYCGVYARVLRAGRCMPATPSRWRRRPARRWPRRRPMPRIRWRRRRRSGRAMRRWSGACAKAPRWTASGCATRWRACARSPAGPASARRPAGAGRAAVLAFLHHLGGRGRAAAPEHQERASATPCRASSMPDCGKARTC